MVLCMVFIIPVLAIYLDWIVLVKSVLITIPVLGLAVAIAPVINWIASKIFNDA